MSEREDSYNNPKQTPVILSQASIEDLEFIMTEVKVEIIEELNETLREIEKDKILVESTGNITGMIAAASLFIFYRLSGNAEISMAEFTGTLMAFISVRTIAKALASIKYL